MVCIFRRWSLMTSMWDDDDDGDDEVRGAAGLRGFRLLRGFSSLRRPYWRDGCSFWLSNSTFINFTFHLAIISVLMLTWWWSDNPLWYDASDQESSTWAQTCWVWFCGPWLVPCLHTRFTWYFMKFKPLLFVILFNHFYPKKRKRDYFHWPLQHLC